ncbi:MAG TPA: hypothetical protein PLT27_11945, partial [Nitrospira sp.]|nr:hypothetical protein [Nitrospira sp.]
QQVDRFYAQLDAQQRHVVDLVLTSLDQLVTAVQECDRHLQTANGTGEGSQSDMNGKGARSGGQTAKPPVSRPRRSSRQAKTGAQVNGRRQARKRS